MMGMGKDRRERREVRRREKRRMSCARLFLGSEYA